MFGCPSLCSAGRVSRFRYASRRRSTDSRRTTLPRFGRRSLVPVLVLSLTLAGCAQPDTPLSAQPGPSPTARIAPIGNCRDMNHVFFEHLEVEFDAVRTSSIQWSEDLWLIALTWAPTYPDGAIIYDEVDSADRPFITGVWATDAHPRDPGPLEDAVIVPIDPYASFFSDVVQSEASSASERAHGLFGNERAIRMARSCSERGPQF